MLSSFLRPKQETKRTAFCNYLASEVEALEDKNFQTFRNAAIKLLSSIQSKAEKRSHQPQQPQQQILSRSSSATSTFVPKTFQQLQQPAPAAREYILTIPETQITASQAIQPAQQSQVQPKDRSNPEVIDDFLVIDDQQVGPLRPLAFTLTQKKHFNPPSVASAQANKVNTTYQDTGSFFGNL